MPACQSIHLHHVSADHELNTPIPNIIITVEPLYSSHLWAEVAIFQELICTHVAYGCYREVATIQRLGIGRFHCILYQPIL